MSDPLPDADGEHSGPTSAAGTGGADEPRTPRGGPLPHTPRDAHSADGSLPSQPLHLRIMTIVFGLMFLATLAILGHLMWIAEPPPGMPLDRFFAAVESGRADKVLSLCDPRDTREPAAAQPERHVMSGQALPQRKTRRVCGTGHFARGSVYAELCLENGRLTDIFIVSQGLSAQWPDTPEVLQLCRQRAERFLINRVPGEYLDPQAVNPQGFWAPRRYNNWARCVQPSARRPAALPTAAMRSGWSMSWTVSTAAPRRQYCLHSRGSARNCQTGL